MKAVPSSLSALAALTFIAIAAGSTTSNLRTTNADSKGLWNQSYVVMGHGISYVND